MKSRPLLPILLASVSLFAFGATGASAETRLAPVIGDDAVSDQSGLVILAKCIFVNGERVCFSKSSKKHRDDDDDDDDHKKKKKKKHNDDDDDDDEDRPKKGKKGDDEGADRLEGCSVIIKKGQLGGGGCKAPNIFVCRKFKNGDKCCGCAPPAPQ